MEETPNLETLFQEKIQPYVERIKALEEAQGKKDLEIVTLKHAISNLNSIIVDLNSKMEKEGNQKGGPQRKTGSGRRVRK